MDDLEAVSELIAACDIATYGTPDISLEEIRTAWQSPQFNLETDAYVVVAPRGRIVGYGDVEDREHVRLYSFVRVHPDYCGRGIGTHLLGLTEARARQHILHARPGTRISLNNWIVGVDEAARGLLQQEGYKLIRHSWRMEIELDEIPLVPAWPEGITIRTFVPGQDEFAVFTADQEAFQDHWGYMPINFELWEHWALKREGFDPSLWFLAVAGDEIAGLSLCKYEMDLGWVDTLAVLRPWRRKGLGMALLRHSFAEFYRRGTHKIGLGVDAQNLTGATRLYERAGMHVARQYDVYEKELRAGVELSTQSLTV
jgi:mycothiol synthase